MREPGPAKLYEFRDHVRTLAEWARLVGLPRRLLQQRLTEGWSLEEALTTPERAPAPAPETETRHCIGCRYAIKLHQRDDSRVCDYLIQTGHRRPVKVADCAGWDNEGRWRGAGPEPGKEETP